MGKLLRLRDYILLTAALSGEVFEEIRLIGGLLPSAMKAQYGYVPPNYKRTSYLSTVSQMLSTGEIERKIDRKGSVTLELTSAGKKGFTRRFPLFNKAAPWDGVFMVVIFDIPEKDKKIRDNLRAKLVELGFGMLQKSVWVSPYHFEEDMREFLVLKGLENEVFVLSAKRLWTGDAKMMAERIWKLKSINSRYLRVAGKVKRLSRLEKGEKTKALKKAYKMYLDTLATDPLLPTELLPNYWSRGKVVRLLNQALKLREEQG